MLLRPTNAIRAKTRLYQNCSGRNQQRQIRRRKTMSRLIWYWQDNLVPGYLLAGTSWYPPGIIPNGAVYDDNAIIICSAQCYRCSKTLLLQLQLECHSRSGWLLCVQNVCQWIPLPMSQEGCTIKCSATSDPSMQLPFPLQKCLGSASSAGTYLATLPGFTRFFYTMSVLDRDLAWASGEDPSAARAPLR